MLLHRTTARQLLVRSSLSFWLPVLMLLLQAQTGLAQFEQTAQQNTVEADSSRGYWRLKTQAATRSTLIQFFGGNHQLLYEEILPEKWVKLSRKNQKQFDELLAQLLDNQLVTSRIKTEILPPTPVETVPPSVPVKSTPAPYSASTTAAYQVHAYVNSSGKLYLIVNNPDRLRYKISVVGQGNRSLYEEFTNHNQYRRKLDLSALLQDSYQVLVQIDDKPFIYKIRRQDSRYAYSIQPGSVVGKEAPIEQIETILSPRLSQLKLIYS